MTSRARKVSRNRQAGFSLIELMASAVILGVTVSGVMAMIGAGRDYELGKELRRQAGILAHSKLEDTLYHHSEYAAIASPFLQEVAVNLNTTAANVLGTLSVEVSDGSMGMIGILGGNVEVPYKKILVKVSWVSTQADFVVLQKRVVQVSP